MEGMDAAELRELYFQAYGCSVGPDCRCKSAEEIEAGDDYVRRRAEAKARTQEAGE